MQNQPVCQKWGRGAGSTAAWIYYYYPSLGKAPPPLLNRIKGVVSFLLRLLLGAIVKLPLVVIVMVVVVTVLPVAVDGEALPEGVVSPLLADGGTDDLTPPQQSSSPSPIKIHLRVLPLGDSISLCCHHCGVAAGILPRRYRGSNAEPNRPWEGYIKQLYRLLEKQGFKGTVNHGSGGNTKVSTSTGNDRRYQLVSSLSSFKNNNSTEVVMVPVQGSFSYEGRVRTCMMNGTSAIKGRVDTSDWSVRYEAYYGITSGGLLENKLDGALTEFYQPRDGTINSTDYDTSDSGVPSVEVNVILLHIGTNDLIQPRLKNRVNGAISNVRSILHRIRAASAAAAALGRIVSSGDGGKVSNKHKFMRRVDVVVVSAISPMAFSVIGGDRLAPQLSKKAYRWSDFNRGLKEMVASERGYLDVPSSSSSTISGGGSSSSSNQRGSSSSMRIRSINTNIGGDGQHPFLLWDEAEDGGHSQGGGLHVLWVDPNEPILAGDDEEEKRSAKCPALTPKLHLHGDGLHPNVDGERIIAASFFSRIRWIVQLSMSAIRREVSRRKNTTKGVALHPLFDVTSREWCDERSGGVGGGVIDHTRALNATTSQADPVINAMLVDARRSSVRGSSGQHTRRHVDERVEEDLTVWWGMPQVVWGGLLMVAVLALVAQRWGGRRKGRVVSVKVAAPATV